MRPATRKDAQKSIDIIARSFATNPSILWVIKQDRKQAARIVALARYSFYTALLRKGAYLSDNGHGVALCYRASVKGPLLPGIWNQLVLAVRAIGLLRIGIVLKRQAYVQAQMPKNMDYLYFWFFGVDPLHRGQGDAAELKNEVFSMARKENLPIYMETSVEKNRRVYEHYGFNCYHTWKVDKPAINLYFLRKETV